MTTRGNLLLSLDYEPLYNLHDSKIDQRKKCLVEYRAYWVKWTNCWQQCWRIKIQARHLHRARPAWSHCSNVTNLSPDWSRYLQTKQSYIWYLIHSLYNLYKLNIYYNLYPLQGMPWYWHHFFKIFIDIKSVSDGKGSAKRVCVFNKPLLCLSLHDTFFIYYT